MENKTECLPMNGTDYVEFYVGNAKQAAHFYQSAFGFQPVAFAGLETGLVDRVSYVLKQDKITFVLTGALTPDSEVAIHHKQHGDGVKTIALWVDDSKKSFIHTTEKGAEVNFAPFTLSDDDGEVVISSIKTYGDTVHTFVERKNYNGLFMPGFIAWNPEYQPQDTGLLYVDHIVGNVGWNEMDKVVGYYRDVMGFDQLISFDDKDISTEFTALKSKVMAIATALALITIPGYMTMHGARSADYDAFLTLTVVLYCFAFFHYCQTSKPKYLYYFFGFLLMGIMSKSIAAFLVLPALGIYALWDKKVLEILKSKHFYIGLFSVFAIVFAYYFTREQVNPGYWEAVQMNELGGRFSNTLEDNKGSFLWYYDFLVSML